MAYLIAVDSGHGMGTAGKRTPAIPANWFGKNKGSFIREKEFNKPTAEYLIKALERCGFKTINVSPGTADVSLKDRYTAANNAKADALISKHYNAYLSKWGNHSGIETIISQYASKETKRLAELVQSELVKEHKRINRGVKIDIKQSGVNLAVLRNSNMPAILTESGFMDNLDEAKTMLDPKFQKADADATCRGVCAYFNVKYVPESNVPTKTITPASSKKDIKWLQEKLNKALPKYKDITPLEVDGDYGSRTRIAVLLYWESLGWARHMNGDGKKAGKATRRELGKL